MNEKERARQREYNKRYQEKYPDKACEWVKKKYREDEKYRERTKWLQKKNYYKRMGYTYEQYDMPDAWNVLEHLKDYIYEAEEVKITKQNGHYLFEVKIKI